MSGDLIRDALRSLCKRIHRDNQKWWRDLNTGEPVKRNVGEMLSLSISEIAEASAGMPSDLERDFLLMRVVRSLSRALEGHRKDKMDDHLPHRKMFEVELADACIRIF